MALPSAEAPGVTRISEQAETSVVWMRMMMMMIPHVTTTDQRFPVSELVVRIAEIVVVALIFSRVVGLYRSSEERI